MLSANRNFYRVSARIRKKTVPEENYVFGIPEKNSKRQLVGGCLQAEVVA
jgi:hypothetical protein